MPWGGSVSLSTYGTFAPRVEGSWWLCAACVGMSHHVPISVAQPFVLTNISPDVPETQALWQPGHLFQTRLGFPSLVSQKLCAASPLTPSQFSLRVSQGASRKSAAIGKVQMDGSKDFAASRGGRWAAHQAAVFSCSSSSVVRILPRGSSSCSKIQEDC